jgi:ribonuclease D
VNEWHDAIQNGLSLPEEELPRSSPRRTGPPPPRVWAEKFPEAAARLGRAREVIATLAAEYDLPAENLIGPPLVRGLAWDPPDPVTADAVATLLAEGGARPWQVELTAAPLAAAVTSA